MTGLPAVSMEDPAAARRMLDDTPLGAVEIARPPLGDLPYRDFVHALLRAGGFKLDFNGLEPDAALALVCDQILGAGVFTAERALLANDIAALTSFAAGLTGGRATVAIRTYFAPGDLVWHVDRVNERTAFRVLWPLGRPAGMRVTPADSIAVPTHAAYMHREHPLLCQLDAEVLRTGATLETLWAHRPAQVTAMISGDFPFLLERDRDVAVTPGAISIHRIQTPGQPGTYHRSDWANRALPGLQVVVTAVSDDA